MPKEPSPSHRSIGDHGETIAVNYLLSQGYTIIDRNYQIKGGEIDIVAQKGGFHIFIEVRYRYSDTYGHPLDTFSPSKKRTLKRAIMIYISKHKIDSEHIRIDFIGIMPYYKKNGGFFRLWHIKGINL
ncbi:YraN family protein [Candidatus Gracilibacteria bacterium]|nr:YraN family protein [Candidatus Gracilibacteria bacterium]